MVTTFGVPCLAATLAVSLAQGCHPDSRDASGPQGDPEPAGEPESSGELEPSRGLDDYDAAGPPRAVRFSEQQIELLRTLAPERLPPPPPDPSNRYADDPAAVAFGRILFHERGFSGPLLDRDNDGGPNTLGTRGEPGRVSCAGCHIEAAGFSDNRSTFREISLGSGWTHRRTPALLDVGQAPLVHWGGRHSTLFGQVFGPLENPLEMNSARLHVATYVADHYREQYERVFGEGTLDPLLDGQRFVRLAPESVGCRLTRDVAHPRALPPDLLYACHGMPGDGAEYDALSPQDQRIVTEVVVNVGKAIAAFERTLRCGPGRFDEFVHGNPEALTESEQRGLELFIGKAGCVECHSGPYFSDQRFHNIGVAQRVTREGILNDGDRGAATDLAAAARDPLGIGGKYSDGADDRLSKSWGETLEGAFRTPTLRCVSRQPTYMHTGLVLGLGAVVEFFDRGGDPGGYPGVNVLQPLHLDRSEKADLVAFLRALDGRAGE